MISSRTKEKLGKAAFFFAAALTVVAVCAIFIFLIAESLPAFAKIGFFPLVLGSDWSPDRLDTYNSPLSGVYGILPMIAGTSTAALGALAIGGTLGYFTSVFIVFYCPKKFKKLVSAIIDLLAGIPSVVYGFFGIVFLLPILSGVAPNNGSGPLAVSIILGIMIMPTVVSLCKTSLKAVPQAYYEGSVALGATHSETVFRIISPAARSGITASLVLGMGRALGETMAVVMVAGNAPTYPDGIFSSFRVLTANIVMEMGYAGEVQEGVLIASGVILLIFILGINIAFAFFSARSATKEKYQGANRKKAVFKRFEYLISTLSRKMKIINFLKLAAIACGIFSVAVLIAVIGFIFIKGTPYLLQNPSLIYGKYEFASEKITVLPAIVTTVYAVVLSLSIALPTGIMTAIFLNEYAKQDNLAVKLIRSAVDILSGVPSIVYGLFGMVFFLPLLGKSSSIIAGALTVSIMLLPTVVRTTEESLKSVSDQLRQGSLALGAGKLRTIFKIVIPSALPGIMSAVILSMGRVLGESAPLLYTMGSVITAIPKSIFDSGATLAVALYQLSGEGWYLREAYATAVVLILLVLLLNFTAELFAHKLSKKFKGARYEKQKNK